MEYLKFVLFFLVFLLSGCSSVTPIEETLVAPERGNYQVGFKEFEWFDSSRERTIKVAIWYPSLESSEKIRYLAFKGFAKKDAVISNGRFPLIVVSHGTGGHRYNQFFITEFLASFGYIIAAIEHPNNNSFNNKDQGSVANLWNRPKDISFIIDQLIKEETLFIPINKDKIGFIGHSIGGYTGFVLAGAIPDFRLVLEYCKQHSEDHLMCDTRKTEQEKKTNYSFDFSKLSDQRIQAMFVMAPALGQAFNSKNMKNVEIPIFLLASGRDEVLIKPYNIDRYRSALKEKIFYFEFPNAGHYVYIHECPFIVKMMAKDACNDIGTPRSEIHPKLRKLCLDFFEDRLKSPK